MSLCEDKDLFFKNDMLDQFMCPIGKGVITKPVLLSCSSSHVYCQCCIESWLQKQSICPICSEKVDKKIKQMTFLSNIASNFKRKCEHKECNWTGIQDNYITHKKECLFEPIKCKHNDCAIVLLRKDIIKHEEECDLMPIQCNMCNVHVPKRSLDDHFKNCPKREIKCELCNDTIKFCDQIEHKNICKEIEINCKYNRIGCDFKCKRKDIDDHYNDKILFHTILIDKDRNGTDLISSFPTIQNESIELELETGKFYYFTDTNNIIWRIFYGKDNSGLMLIRPACGNGKKIEKDIQFLLFDYDKNEYFDKLFSNGKKLYYECNGPPEFIIDGFAIKLGGIFKKDNKIKIKLINF